MSEEQAEPRAEDAKKAEALRVLGDVLGHMGVSAALDCKDVPDGSLSIAVMVEAEVAGLVPGKRNHVADSLQFLINKIVNKTPQTRRYINIGIGEHPKPRQQKQPAEKQQQKPVTVPVPAPEKQKPLGEKQQKVTAAGGPPKHKPQQQARSQGGQKQNEASLEVEEDAALTAAVRELAEKSAKHGRYVGLIGMTAEDRARVLRAVQDVPGVSAKLEGEGRARRLSLHPDKPSAMPKSMLPDYDDEDDDEEQE